MFRNRVKIFIIIFLVVIEFTSFFFMIKAFNNRDLKTTKEEHVVDKEKYGMFIENEEGKYVEYTDSTLFPSNLKYTFNETKSSCVDTLNKEVENAILSNNDKITITSNKTVFCYLYFDLDKEPPQAFTFYIGGNSNPTYTNTITTIGYISWSDTDIDKYCITTSSTSDNCTWNDVSDNTITTDYILSSGDGTKTIYAYLKDIAGNITQGTDTIILDTTAPVISSVTKTTDVETSIGISVSASDDNGISNYYYSINNGSYAESTSSTKTFSGLTAGTTYSISVYVEDPAGNISEVTTKSFTTYESKEFGKYLLNHPTTGLNTTLEGGLYRYQGTSVNNYVCFGTKDKDTCTKNDAYKTKYLYRIIGINSNNQVKLISALSKGSMRWYSSNDSKITWKTSTIYSSINGSYFLTNTDYVPTAWKSKISDTTWKYGSVVNYSYATGYNGDNVYNLENAWTTTVSAKIGLMYIHDYYYGYSNGSPGTATNAKTSWIHLDSQFPEWTMTLYQAAKAWLILSGGQIVENYLSAAYADKVPVVRPVFYLTSDVEYISGSGTSTDPFIIS